MYGETIAARPRMMLSAASYSRCAVGYDSFARANAGRFDASHEGHIACLLAYSVRDPECAAWAQGRIDEIRALMLGAVQQSVVVYGYGYGYGRPRPISRPGRWTGRNAGAYPARSDAISASPGALWWQANYDGINHLCATQGITLVRQFQQIARNLVPLAYTVDGVAFSSADVTVDGNFGPGSFGALRQILTGLDIPQSVLDAIRNDWQRLCPTGRTRAGARGLPISLATMAALIFVAAHRESPWSSISIPTTMRTLSFAFEPGDDGSHAGVIVCAPFSEGLAGLEGPNARNVPPGGATPIGTPTVPPADIGSPPAAARSSGSGMALVVGLLLVGALAAGKKRL